MLRKIGRFGTTLLIASSLGIVSSLSNPLPSVAGVVTLPDGGRCEGEVSNGGLNGKVVCQYANGDRYEGNFVNGKKQGQSVYTFSGGGRYEGEFSDDKPNGKGVRAYPEGTTKE